MDLSVAERPSLNVEALIRLCQARLPEEAVDGIGEVLEQLRLSQMADGTSVDELVGAIYGQFYQLGLDHKEVEDLFRQFAVFD